MAKKRLEILVDDIDGGEADETVVFGLDGETFEIDLTSDNAQALRDVLAPYIDKGRRSTAKRPRRKAAKGAASGSATPSAQIRAWAAENGYTVNSRGRIPADVVAAYEAAHA